MRVKGRETPSYRSCGPPRVPGDWYPVGGWCAQTPQMSLPGRPCGGRGPTCWCSPGGTGLGLSTSGVTGTVSPSKASLFGTLSDLLVVVILSHCPFILGLRSQEWCHSSAERLGRVSCHQLIINAPEDCGAIARRPIYPGFRASRVPSAAQKEPPSLGIRTWALGLL